MPESSNVEVAHQLQHGEHAPAENAGEQTSTRSRRERWTEIGEALLLALVAIATAWSGYQSAQWDGRSANEYALAGKYRVESDEASTLGGQHRLYDVSTFNSWLLATTQGNHRAADLLAERFSDEYDVAFRAWLDTDPFTNPDAPAGPMFMPEYHNHLEERGRALAAKASESLDRGASLRGTSEDYVRITVLLATVLFIIALSQRFGVRNVRFALLGVASVLLIVGLVSLASLPRQ